MFQSMLVRMESLVNELKKDKESSIDQVKKLQQDMQAAVLKIKVNLIHWELCSYIITPNKAKSG